MPESPPTIREDRFAELAAMQDGWYDGRGKKPTQLAVEIARSFVACFGDAHIYPTLEGGIQIEQDADHHCWEICIGPRGGTTALYVNTSRLFEALGA